MKHLSTSGRLILLVCVMSVLLLFVGAIGLIGIYKTNDGLKTVYADRTVPMWQLSEIQRLMQRNWLIVAVGQDAKSAEFNARFLPDAEENLTTVDSLFADYLKTYLTPKEQEVAALVKQDLENFVVKAYRPALAALRDGNYPEVNRLQLQVMIPISEPYRIDLQALIRLQMDIASAEYTAALDRFRTIRNASISSMMIGVIFAIVFGGFLVRSIVLSRLEFEHSLTAKRDLERQLQQSQKAQALGQLTGGIAHDFNNILAAILGYANLALDRHAPDKDSKLAKYLREVISASERARDLVAKMLTFTRTQPSDSVSLIAPADVIGEVQSMLCHSIPASIQLKVSIQDDGTILMDAGELNQVLVNLIINSRDAILGQGHAHGRVEIVVHRVDVNNQVSLTTHQRFSGTFLAVDVSDSGNGIPLEYLSRVFDPFFTTKDVGKGTGLGLSMVQGIMTRAGGHILLQSRVGEGTRFQLLFPIPADERIRELAEPERHSAAQGSGQLIWVVDDEPAITGYLDELLTGWGYKTRVFNDPVLALEAFKNELPPLQALVTDMTMPGLSGAELVKAIRSFRTTIPVLFCTGLTDGVDRSEIPDLKYSKTVLKPVSSSDLERSLSDLLRA
jgi:signal transduction histidine kinase